MFQVTNDWNPLQTRLKEIILKKDYFAEMKELLLKMHSFVHSSKVYESKEETYMDEVWKDLSDKAFRTMPTKRDNTIAWDIWHLTRIEDLTANLLMDKGNQVFNEAWQIRLNTKVKDTGNAMSDEEIMQLSHELNMQELYEYRIAVGIRTKEIIQRLQPEDIKRKVEKEQLDRILMEGGVTTQPDSIWLLDFWGRKNMAGLIQMPFTRHQIVHLNECIRLKKVCAKMK